MTTHTTTDNKKLIKYKLYYDGKPMEAHTFQETDMIDTYIEELNKDCGGIITYEKA